MKLAICGSRDLELYPSQLFHLLSVFNIKSVTEIVSGRAKGIDQSAFNYSISEELPIKEFPADWDKYGKSAGPIRNKQIADYSDTLLVIRYEDSRGSMNVASEFRKLNKPVYEIILPREL